MDKTTLRIDMPITLFNLLKQKFYAPPMLKFIEPFSIIFALVAFHLGRNALGRSFSQLWYIPLIPVVTTLSIYIIVHFADVVSTLFTTKSYEIIIEPTKIRRIVDGDVVLDELDKKKVKSVRLNDHALIVKEGFFESFSILYEEKQRKEITDQLKSWGWL